MHETYTYTSTFLIFTFGECMAVYIYLALGHHAADMYDDIPLSHIILTPIRLVLTLASMLCAMMQLLVQYL